MSSAVGGGAAPTPSFPASPVATTSAAASAGTFWCHECDMSVSLPLPSSTPLVCPHCSSDFIEEMDSPPPLPHQTLTDSDSSSPSSPRPLSPQSYLHRLIEHLDTDYPLPPLPARGPSPAPQSAIDAVPTVHVTDPALLCAICKDDLPLASPARRLPCSHLYHSDCIVPWLSQHNSCPVCRSGLPDDRPPQVLASVSLNTLRDIARRHRLVFPMRPPPRASPTQMAQADTGSEWPTTSGETVSSAWVHAEAQNGGAGGGRVDEEGDTVMSDSRIWEDLFD